MKITSIQVFVEFNGEIDDEIALQSAEKDATIKKLQKMGFNDIDIEYDDFDGDVSTFIITLSKEE